MTIARGIHAARRLATLAALATTSLLCCGRVDGPGPALEPPPRFDGSNEAGAGGTARPDGSNDDEVGGDNSSGGAAGNGGDPSHDGSGASQAAGSAGSEGGGAAGDNPGGAGGEAGSAGDYSNDGHCEWSESSGGGNSALAPKGKFWIIEPLPEHSQKASLVADSTLETWLVQRDSSGLRAIAGSRWYAGTNLGVQLVSSTPEGGSVGLGTLPDTAPEMYYVGAVNPSLTAMIGKTFSLAAGSVPFRWTQAGGIKAISADGPINYIGRMLISDDGATAFAEWDGRTVRYDESGKAEDIGVLPQVQRPAPGYLTSDGSTLYGSASTASRCEGSCTVNVLFRWRKSEGFRVIDGPSSAETCYFSGIPFPSTSTGVLAIGDCSLSGGGSASFAWREGAPWVGFGRLPGLPRSLVQLSASDVSSAWGYATDFKRLYPWHWTAATGPVPFQPAPGFVGFIALSKDGSKMLGNVVDNVVSRRVFRDCGHPGVDWLRTLPGDRFSDAVGMSADGKRVLGSSSSPRQSRPVLWVGEEPLPLASLIPDVDSGLASKLSVEGISADGRVLWGSVSVGNGSRAWLIKLDH